MYNNKTMLPQELIVEILLRLPVKSLIRFRCVSKSWLSLISDPNFAKSHFDLTAAPSNHKLLYITDSSSEALSIDLEASLYDDTAATKLLLPLPESSIPPHNLLIMGSCRGFVLLDNFPNLILWNPSTNVHKQISYSPSVLSARERASLLYGFGYDACADDYLVVIARQGGGVENFLTHFEVFSVRTDSWKEVKIHGMYFPYSEFRNQSGLFYNGAIHWLAYREHETVSVIIGFDLMEKDLFEVSLPGFDFLDGYFTDLRMMGECLSVCFKPDRTDRIGETWVMEDYKVQSSWTVSLVLKTSRYFYPICFTKGYELVALNGRAKLLKFSYKGELLERRRFKEYRSNLTAAEYAETLLSLPSDSGEAMEDQQ